MWCIGDRPALSGGWSGHIAGVPPLPLSIVPCQPGWACPHHTPHHTIPHHAIPWACITPQCAHHPSYSPTSVTSTTISINWGAQAKLFRNSIQMVLRFWWVAFNTSVIPSNIHNTSKIPAQTKSIRTKLIWHKEGNHWLLWTLHYQGRRNTQRYLQKYLGKRKYIVGWVSSGWKGRSHGRVVSIWMAATHSPHQPLSTPPPA